MTDTICIKKLKQPANIHSCQEVILHLRPHLMGSDLAGLFETMQAEGFQLVYAEDAGRVVAFAGYRLMQLFFSGRTLYIDDLATLPEYQNKGYASALLDYLVTEARALHCDAVTLDSGYQRHTAHRLYLNKQFRITAYHFHLDLSKTT